MTELDPNVKKFIRYFVGRSDRYGHNNGFSVKRALTPQIYQRHLTSLDPDDWIGVYCLIGTQCSWGCVDIDGKDFPVTKLNPDWPHVGNRDPQYIVQHDWDRMYGIATDVRTALLAFDIPSHLEETVNGYHLWVFPNDAVLPAATMRRALLVACQIADYQPKEVNPKQEAPKPGQLGLGNYVRLPYGGHMSGGDDVSPRMMLASDGSRKLGLLEWLDSDPERADVACLEKAAELYVPPPSVALTLSDLPSQVDRSITDKLNGVAWTIFNDGPLPGADRSNTLVRLAHACMESGLSTGEAFAVVVDADRRWGKFADRPDRDEQIMRIVERAYS